MALVGRIVRPHGNKGNVVVSPETDFGADRFRPGASLYWLRAGEPAPVEVVESREHDGRWIVGLAGVTTIDGAEALRGLELRIAPDALRQLGSGQYYAHDLAGCRVETMAGAIVGTVDRVDLAVGTPLLVVAGRTGEVLVPLAEEICRRIDVGSKLIVIEPPAGLIELNERRARGDD